MNKKAENNRNYALGFSIAGSLLLILFFVFINYSTGGRYPWFIYPSFAVIWWPLSVFLVRPRTLKAYSVFGALFILAFLTVDNIINSPFCPWVLFTVFPVMMWPVCILLGKRAKDLPTAIGLSLVGILYYAALNILVFPGFPWAIFPAYLLLWWPTSIAFAGRGHEMLFSVFGTLISAALFITLNVLTTPHNIWAVYPIFALAWWPLAIYYFVYKARSVTVSKK